MGKLKSSTDTSSDRPRKDSFFIKPQKNRRDEKKFSNQKASTNKRNKEEGSKTAENKIKKPFDKKKWRFQKYSRKYVFDKFNEKRENQILRQYYKTVEDEEKKNPVVKFDVQKIYEEYKDEQEDLAKEGEIDEENENNLNTSINRNQRNQNLRQGTIMEDSMEPSTSSNMADQIDGGKKMYGKNKKPSNAYQKAQQEYLRLKAEKAKKKEEYLRLKLEREKALKEYKKNKLEKFKRLNKKTRKGQPVMKDRMEMLFEKIQSLV